MATETAEIPLVSFEPFLHGNAKERAEVAQQVYQAFHDVGFLYLKDCGISQDRVAQIFEMVCILPLPYNVLKALVTANALHSLPSSLPSRNHSSLDMRSVIRV